MLQENVCIQGAHSNPTLLLIILLQQCDTECFIPYQSNIIINGNFDFTKAGI